MTNHFHTPLDVILSFPIPSPSVVFVSPWSVVIPSRWCQWAGDPLSSSLRCIERNGQEGQGGDEPSSLCQGGALRCITSKKNSDGWNTKERRKGRKLLPCWFGTRRNTARGEETPACLQPKGTQREGRDSSPAHLERKGMTRGEEVLPCPFGMPERGGNSSLACLECKGTQQEGRDSSPAHLEHKGMTRGEEVLPCLFGTLERPPLLVWNAKEHSERGETSPLFIWNVKERQEGRNSFPAHLQCQGTARGQRLLPCPFGMQRNMTRGEEVLPCSFAMQRNMARERNSSPAHLQHQGTQRGETRVTSHVVCYCN